jgi:hypothetical protein
MSLLRQRLHRAAAFVLLSSAAIAQTGPWTDGEILVRAPGVNPPNPDALWRIDPLTGQGAQILTGHTYGSPWGRLAFDSYRGGFVTCMALLPDASNALKIWLLRHDGSAEHLPGFEGQQLAAFCPTGDGRIFFQVHPSSASSPIHWIDEHGASHTLLDASGTTPLALQVEHMLYHQPSNSLVATTSPFWSTQNCGTGGPNAFRVPLSADGTKVGGPILCNEIASSWHYVLTLDELPNGNLLLVSGTGTFGPVDRMIELDPWTVTDSAWANPQSIDLNGGLWSDLLGTSIVLDDNDPDQLRKYSFGQSGAGTVLATNVNLANGTTGHSPGESIWETKVTTGDGNYCTTGANSTGKAAHMGFKGSKSLSENDFTLTAGPVPDAPFLFIYGPAKHSAPFGNGTLCIGGGVKRILPGAVAAGNVATVSPDLAALQLVPGAWHFQCWFRDIAAGGAQFDLSDATQVTFVP